MLIRRSLIELQAVDEEHIGQRGVPYRSPVVF